MTEYKLRNKVSVFVIISYSVLFLTVIIYNIVKGFDDEELVSIMGFLAPVTAVYIGGLIKYIVAHKNVVEEDADVVKEKKVTKMYVILTYWAIPLHFILLFLIINRAGINLFTFEQLKIYFVMVETAFGAYVGIIMGSLFKVDDSLK